MFAAGRVLGERAAGVARVERRPGPAAAGVVAGEGVIPADGIDHRSAARIAQRDVVLEGHRHCAADRGKVTGERAAGRSRVTVRAGRAAGIGADQRDELHVGGQDVAQVEGGHRLAGGDLGGDGVLAREVGAGGGLILRAIVGLGEGEQGGGDAVRYPTAQAGAGIVAAAPVIERGIAELVAAARLDGERRAQVSQVAHCDGHIHRDGGLIRRKGAEGQAQSDECVAGIPADLNRIAGVIHHIRMIHAGHAAGAGEGQNGVFDVHPQIGSADEGQAIQRQVGVLRAVCAVGGEDEVNQRAVAGDGVSVVEGDGEGHVAADEGFRRHV